MGTAWLSRVVFAVVLVAVAGCTIRSEPTDLPATKPAPEEVAGPTIAGPNHRPPATAMPLSATAVPTPTPPPSTPTPAPTDAAEPAILYRAQAGDTLWGIAIAHGVSLDALLVANSLTDPDTIWAGQELLIPGAGAMAPPPPEPPTGQDTSSAGRQTLETAQEFILPDDFPRTGTARLQPVPAVDLRPLVGDVLLEPMLHDWQKMNNCAPTTVAMALSYYGELVTQFDTAPVLKGSPDDKNVSPAELAAYLQGQGYGGIVRVNGDIQTLLRLVSNQIPVIVEQWLERPDDELTGHYRVVRGYDQSTQEFVVNDSYSGPRLRFSFAEFDRLWRPFNRTYLPVFTPESEAVVRAIVGDEWDERAMYARAVENAQTEVAAQGDVYAWFNLGNSLLGLGEYHEAAAAFDQALQIGLPPRMLWYQFGPFEAFNRTVQYQRVLDLSRPLLGLALEELHYQRGVAYEGLGDHMAALAEYQKAVAFNPRLTKAAEAASRLQAAGGG